MPCWLAASPEKRSLMFDPPIVRSANGCSWFRPVPGRDHRAGLATAAPPMVISQARVEARLRDHLAELGGEPEWSSALVAADQDPDGVTAVLGDGRTMRARWLVGCDGTGSTVRDAHAWRPVAAARLRPGLPRRRAERGTDRRTHAAHPARTHRRHRRVLGPDEASQASGVLLQVQGLVDGGGEPFGGEAGAGAAAAGRRRPRARGRPRTAGRPRTGRPPEAGRRPARHPWYRCRHDGRSRPCAGTASRAAPAPAGTHCRAGHPPAGRPTRTPASPAPPPAARPRPPPAPPARGRCPPCCRTRCTPACPPPPGTRPAPARVPSRPGRARTRSRWCAPTAGSRARPAARAC